MQITTLANLGQVHSIWSIRNTPNGNSNMYGFFSRNFILNIVIIQFIMNL